MMGENCMGTHSYHSVYNDDRATYGDQSGFPYGTHSSCRWCSHNVVFLENTDEWAATINFTPYGTWVTEHLILEWP